MVQVRNIMATSSERSHARTATLSALSPAAGHPRPIPPPETPGHSRESLGQCLVGSLLLSPGSWCMQGSVCALPESVSPVLCKCWWLCGGVNGNLLPWPLCCTQVYCTQSPPPQQSTAEEIIPQETPKYSFVSVSVGSLGPGVHKVCLSPLSVSGGYGV